MVRTTFFTIFYDLTKYYRRWKIEIVYLKFTDRAKFTSNIKRHVAKNLGFNREAYFSPGILTPVSIFMLVTVKYYRNNNNWKE